MFPPRALAFLDELRRHPQEGERMTLGTIVWRLLLAFVLGGLIGWEREHEEKPAGLRTFILVCVGAALSCWWLRRPCARHEV